MKKILVPTFILVTLVAGYFVWESGTSSPATTKSELPESVYENISTSQRQVFSKFLKDKELKDPAFKAFTNPKGSADLYLKDASFSVEKGAEFLKKAFNGLKECASSGCGQSPDEDTGFFDAANTVAMVSMKRILEAGLLEPERLKASEWLKKEELYDLLSAPNSEVRGLALKNLLTLHPSSEVMGSVLEKGKELSGTEAGDLIKGVIPHANEDNTDMIVETMVEMIANEDKLTAIDVLEKAEKLPVNQDQVERISDALCPNKSDKKQKANFKTMNYSVNIMARESGINFNLSDYCR